VEGKIILLYKNWKESSLNTPLLALALENIVSFIHDYMRK
jgi:hypothetical protein